MRVLLVEDDPKLATSAAGYLRKSGLAVDVVHDAETALVEAFVTPYDAVVLDLRLPGGDGMEVCRRIRAGDSGMRILMATARDAVEDRIAGLELGADDYLVKPYELGELAARLKALLRRPASAIPDVLRVGALELDTAKRHARRGRREIELTTKEFAVLEYLMRNAGRVVTREQISAHAWDRNYEAFSNVIDVYVGRLRRKIDIEGDSPLLTTVRGSGYRLEDDTDLPLSSEPTMRGG